VSKFTQVFQFDYVVSGLVDAASDEPDGAGNCAGEELRHLNGLLN
jgi:hypothetical protein